MAGRTLLLALLVAATTTRGALAEDVAVIVHAEREVRLTIEEVAQIYLKQRRFWEDGRPIVPVNRDARSSTRESFARLVFGEGVRQLVVYWNRQYFRGVLPPATLASDEAVKRFVASERLAIGYVHPGAVDASVRVVLRIRDPRAGEDERTAPTSDRP